MSDEPLSGLRHTLGTILSLLEASGSGGVVIGGVAAATLGQPRFTHDIDLCAALTSEELPGFYAAAAARGLQPRTADYIAFSKLHRMILLRDVERNTDVAISMAALPFEFEAIAGPCPSTWRGSRSRSSLPRT